MKIILAYDADVAGQNAVQRFLENHLQEIDLPMPHPDEMGMTAYREWLKGLNVRELSNELIRLRDSEYGGADKAKALEDAFKYCRQALDYNSWMNKYYVA